MEESEKPNEKPKHTRPDELVELGGPGSHGLWACLRCGRLLELDFRCANCSAPTHERNALQWAASKLAKVDPVDVMLWIAAALLGVVIFAHLGCASPTSSTDVETPMEEAALGFASCHAKYQELGREVEVVFHDSERGDGAKAWAWPGGSIVNLARPWVNETDLQQLELTVGHEVCHLTGIFDEGQANFCAQLAYRDAGCREETETDETSTDGGNVGALGPGRGVCGLAQGRGNENQ